MDSTFTDACQAIGLALAAGCLFGSLARSGARRYLLAAIATVAGVVLALLAGPPLGLGVAIGIAASLLAYAVASGVAAGAARRSDAGSGTVAALLAFVALLIAVVSLLVAPAALAALLAIAFLAVARRRRAGRKYAGLRILR